MDDAAPTLDVTAFRFEDVPDRFLVLDLEATCWKRKAPVQNETIEIGVVAWSRQQGVLGEFQTFVRPRLAPVLSEFCTGLTHITQADVDAAPAFGVALAAFCAWAEAYVPYTVASWGDYDRRQLALDCGLHGVPYPFERHLNVKQLFARRMSLKPYGMRRALLWCGLTLEGTHHRGIDDARNIVRLLARAAAGPAVGS